MISDEAVEAARAIILPYVDDEHFDLSAVARAALEAAGPYIKAQALDKAADDAEGLGMEEIPVHSLRFRAHCYRNIGANLYGGQS